MGIFYIDFITLNYFRKDEIMDSSSLLSRSSTEEISTNTNNNKSKIASYLRDGLLMTGNAMVTSSNYLIYRAGPLPLVPALCFMIEGSVNSKIALTNLITRYWNINNKVINTSSTVLSFATAPLLPAAVVLLNWPKPNPKTLPVTYAFVTAAVASSLNHIIVAAKKITESCTNTDAENQQPTLWQKIGNTAASLLAPITVASALVGVSFFASYELSDPNNDDDNKSFLNKESTAFYQTITGLATVGAGLLVNTGLEWYKNWCASSTAELNLENGLLNVSSSISSLTSSNSDDPNGDQPTENPVSSLTFSNDADQFNAENINDECAQSAAPTVETNPFFKEGKEHVNVQQLYI